MRAKAPPPALSSPAPDVEPASSTERIAAAITAAIVERRLMPGTKLAEQKLADIFPSRAPWFARP